MSDTPPPPTPSEAPPPAQAQPHTQAHTKTAGPKPRPNLIRIVRRRGVLRWIGLVGFVLMPAVLAAYYFFQVMSDQYEVPVRMVVRTIGVQSGTEEDQNKVSMLSGGAIIQDAHVLANYLRSQEIVATLQDQLNLKTYFARDTIDPLSRLAPDASLEDLHAYWEKQTLSYVDGPSGIIEFSVRAFSAQDAVTIVEAALASASGVVEKLSDQAKADLVTRTRSDLTRSLDRYVQSLGDLRSYQNETGVLNPIADAAASTELIATLIAKKLDAEAQLAVLLASGVRTSPLVASLENEIATLASQVDDQRQQMVGNQPETRELSNVLAKITELETKRLLAESIFRSASRNYDLAVSNVMRQSTFVAVFVPPRAPSEPTYPNRLYLWFIFVTLSAAFWGTVVLVWAAIEDHRD